FAGDSGPESQQKVTVSPMWYIYILETSNGQLYTGITADIARRMKEHQKGKGCRVTKVFGFKKLLYTEECMTRSEALKRESRIKTWDKKKKLALISALSPMSREY